MDRIHPVELLKDKSATEIFGRHLQTVLETNIILRKLVELNIGVGFHSPLDLESGLDLAQVFTQGGGIRTEVYINSTYREWNKDMFDELENRRESIESDLSDALVWERLDNRKACRISSMRSGSIDDDSKTLEEIHIWMIDRLLAFKRVFVPHFEELI